MGIQTEYNPDLALRNIREYQENRRKLEECIPNPLEKDKVYEFLKKGQRNFWLFGEMPLLETKGNQKLSLPLASIIIIEAAHCVIDGEAYTRGKYRVAEVFDPNDKRPHFNGFARIHYDLEGRII
jgi:hypothetical protein